MKTRIHAAAGAVALLTILIFWTSTVGVELFGSHEAVASVKSAILRGMTILVAAMAIVGASGMSLGRKRRDRLTKAKKNPHAADRGERPSHTGAVGVFPGGPGRSRSVRRLVLRDAGTGAGSPAPPISP